MRRIVTYLLACIALGMAFSLLYSSWSQPPPQTTLDLAQTNLSLQAARMLDSPEYQDVASALLGAEDPISTATQRYQQAASTLTQRMAPLQAQRDEAVGTARLLPQQKNLDELNLRAGLLFAQQEKLLKAREYWDGVKTEDLAPVSEVLIGLWDPQSLRILPNAEVLLQRNLDGWFEFVALQKLYRLQQRSNLLQALEQEQEQVAVDALSRLVLLAGIPLVGVLVGVILLIVWGVGAVLQKWPAFGPKWSVPWDMDTMVVTVSIWFIAYLLVGLFVPGVYVSLLGSSPRELGFVQQAIALAITYAMGAAIGFFLIAFTANAYRQPASTATNVASIETEALPTISTDDASESGLQVRFWGRWPLWGLSGYLAALPLVVLAGAVAQKLLPQSGGGNPILPIILNSQGWLPGAIFLVVVSVMAPIFEETLFRGFVLPSLTKVMPVWGAIVLSAIMFAIVHLNVSDLLPLTVLGIVLGTVYSRSRNLLAPMLLHSCWNAGSFAAITILRGGL